jgi:hypothetical protein
MPLSGVLGILSMYAPGEASQLVVLSRDSYTGYYWVFTVSILFRLGIIKPTYCGIGEFNF